MVSGTMSSQQVDSGVADIIQEKHEVVDLQSLLATTPPRLSSQPSRRVERQVLLAVPGRALHFARLRGAV